jgi:glucose/arabinose dehydrogenase
VDTAIQHQIRLVITKGLAGKYVRQGEVPRSGHFDRIDFNDKWEELHRESILRDLQQRIRDIRESPDGYLYLLTAENQGALIRIEPFMN